MLESRRDFGGDIALAVGRVAKIVSEPKNWSLSLNLDALDSSSITYLIARIMKFAHGVRS